MAHCTVHYDPPPLDMVVPVGASDQYLLSWVVLTSSLADQTLLLGELKGAVAPLKFRDLRFGQGKRRRGVAWRRTRADAIYDEAQISIQPRVTEKRPAKAKGSRRDMVSEKEAAGIKSQLLQTWQISSFAQIRSFAGQRQGQVTAI